MEIRYTNDVGEVFRAQLTGFFAGWPQHPSPGMHREILRRSHAVWLAFDGDRCVGFINALSDGVLCAHIPLLEVVPEYRGLGIGRELLRRMVGCLDGLYAIDIACDDSVVPFYERCGFTRCSGVIRRDYPKQGAEHVRAQR